MPLLQDDLVGLTEAIWSSVLTLEVFPIPTEMVGDTLETQSTYTACVAISGGWDGTVAIVIPVELAQALAADMFAMTPDELDAELIRDAIGELANIAGGNIKGIIPDPCELGLPIVAEGTSYKVTMPGTRAVCAAAFECSGHPFTVSLNSASELPIP